jgi:hypothetical protein
LRTLLVEDSQDDVEVSLWDPEDTLLELMQLPCVSPTPRRSSVAPYHQADGEPIRNRSAAPERMTDRTQSSDGAGPTRILIVEDDPNDADIMTRELRRAGLAIISRRVHTEPALREVLDPPRRA